MKIFISDSEWEVKTVPAHDPLLNVGGEYCLGATWYGHQIIAISQEIESHIVIKTIRHELCHAFIYTYTYDERTPESFSEEWMCNFIGTHGKEISDAAEKILNKIVKK